MKYGIFLLCQAPFKALSVIKEFVMKNLLYFISIATGIRFDASPQAGIGTRLEYSWFRAIDPDTSPQLDITWLTQGVTSSNAKVLQMTKLDEFDRKIIDALQANGRLSNIDVAGLVGLSHSSSSVRIAQLERDGVIVG